MNQIIETVSRHYAVSAKDIRSRKRDAVSVDARSMAIYIVWKMTGVSLIVIGKEFGNRDHTTIIHASMSAEKKMKEDQSYAELVEDIIREIKDLS